jgi:hypothetical protein
MSFTAMFSLAYYGIPCLVVLVLALMVFRKRLTLQHPGQEAMVRSSARAPRGKL